jgi:glycosyltransferase involved in cell wall biosynthesis
MTEKPFPDYSIVIPAYNEEQHLPATLLAVRKVMASIEASGELIVVDNNSTDATASIAGEMGADIVIFEPHNQIARARNAGAAASKSDFLIFIDADTLVPGETFSYALELLNSGRVAGGGARIVMDQPIAPVVAFILAGWNSVAGTFGYAAGSFFFCRRDAFTSTGGFDEGVYASEEIWLTKRIKRWGKRRGMKFHIISDPPVETSGRKTNWFSDWEFVLQLGIFFIFPWAVRSKKLCGLWYRRPV